MISTVKIAATAAMSVAVLAPATAHASESLIPPIRSAVDPCAAVTANYRQSVTDAREAKKAAYRAAQNKWHATTSDERTQFNAAGTSTKSFRVTTSDERATRNSSRQAARSAFKDALKAAKAQHRAGLNACR